MADFDRAFAFMIPHEGGYVNDPADPGGETNFGICKRDHPNVDIRNLTLEQAKEIYRNEYWLYEGINDQSVASKVFDLAVNCGKYTANKMLQQACCACGHPTMIDGMLGPNTIYAVNALPPDAILQSLKQEAVEHYRKIAASHPALEKFLKGWTKRALA